MLRIGTSGWQYRHWRGAFYPRGLPPRDWLSYYATAFSTVETNVTFYRLPPPEVFAAWAAALPPEHVVAVKASRFLTHVKRLREPREPVERLLLHSAGLGDRRGPVLLQLPPDMRVDLSRLDETLRAFGGRVRVAVEFRHPSWFVDPIRSLLERHGAALCWADRDSRPVAPIWQTADWIYLRLHHGRGRHGCYGRDALTSWVDRLAALPGADAYVYCNNDGHACAIRNAWELGALARRSGLTVATSTPGVLAPVGTNLLRSRRV